MTKKELAPALSALVAVALFLDETYDLRKQSGAVGGSPGAWLHMAAGVCGRCDEETDYEHLGVGHVERFGDRIAFEAERLAQTLGGSDSAEVMTFVMQSLALAAAHARATEPADGAWLDEIGMSVLERTLAVELEKEPHSSLSALPRVVAASHSLVSFWRGAIERWSDEPA